MMIDWFILSIAGMLVTVCIKTKTAVCTAEVVVKACDDVDGVIAIVLGVANGEGLGDGDMCTSSNILMGSLQFDV